MRTLVYTAARRVEIEDRPRPTIDDGQSEIGIEVAGICGSDISGFLGHSARRKPPLVLGHELVGRLSSGQRVVANPLTYCGRCPACLSGTQNLCSSWKLLGMDQTQGTFAEYVALPAKQIYEIPDSLKSEHAILAEPLANIIHLFRIASPRPFLRFAIVGAGTMGALALSVAKQIGARDILVIDINDERLEIMKQLGASAVINVKTPEGGSEARRFAGLGFDAVLDASGSSATRQTALDICRPGGQVVFLGMAQQRADLDIVTSIRKEHRIIMSFAYTPNDFEHALALLVDGTVDLTPWIAQMRLEEGQSAFEKIIDAPGAILKMMLRISGEC